MKNLVTLFLCLMAVLFLCGIASSQTISIPDTLTANPGDTLWIPITTTNVTTSQQFQAYQYTLTYDQTKLNIDTWDVTGTITPSTWGNTYSFFTGEVNGGAWFMGTPPAYLSGAGTLVFLRVVVATNATLGATTLHFANFYYNETPFPTDDGTLNIIGNYVTVDGMCTLQNQTIHSGTLVDFTPVIGGVATSTYTENSGYYSTLIVPGTYNVTFSHAGFQTVTLTNQNLSTNTTLPTQVLNALPSVNINGIALLEGQTNHSGIYAIFYALTPGALSDTTTTDSTGNYTITIFPGTYDVYFAKLGYDPEALLGQVLNTSQTLPTVTLSPVPTTVTVSFPNIQITWDPDTVISVPISVSYISSFNFVLSYNMYFTYNPNAVQLSTPPYTTEGTITPDNWMSSYTTYMPGIVNGGAFYPDTTGVMWGQGPIVYFNFRLPQNANVNSPLNFQSFQFNDGTPVDVTVNGSITVFYNSVKEIPNAVLPTEFALRQNYPNPFNPATKVEFDVPNTELVQISVYNIKGEVVSVLQDGELSAGTYQVEFDATGLPSGLYFCRMTAGDFTTTKKMMLLE